MPVLRESTMNKRRKRQATLFLEGAPLLKKRAADESEAIHPNRVHLVTGCRNGGCARRKASINAEVSLHLLLEGCPPLISPLVSHTHVPVCVNSNGHTHPDHDKFTPSSFDNDKSLDGADLSVVSLLHDRCSNQQRKGSVSSRSTESPLSSVGSDPDECLSPKPNKSHHLLKDAVVNLVDCKRRTNPKKVSAPRIAKPLSYGTVDSSGYVKRTASLNARACVAALMEPQFKVSRSPKVPCSKVKSENKKMKGENKPSENVVEAPAIESYSHDSDGGDDDCSNMDSGLTVEKSPSRPKGRAVVTTSRIVSEIVVQEQPKDVQTEDKRQQQQAEQKEEKDGVTKEEILCSVPFNTVGLLYNGDTVHPTAPTFLSSERGLPHRIFPQVVPSSSGQVDEAVANAKQQHKMKTNKARALKGDNGWVCMGDAIKTIHYKKGGEIVTRKYYAAIKRRNEEVFVRDAVSVKSGTAKEDKPFIARITALWQESDGIMMTVLWYYRPEDADGASIVEFTQNELMASQHLDDNSVACIEQKCYILGLRPFCRYQAAVKRRQYISRNVIPQNAPITLGGRHMVIARDLDSTSVYLCYRGYNHITGWLPK